MSFKRQFSIVLLALCTVGLITPVAAAPFNSPQSGTVPVVQSTGASSPASGLTRYIVEFQPGKSAASVAKGVAQTHGGTLIRTYANVLNGAVIDIPANALTGLKNNPNILSVEQDAVVTATPIITASQLNAPWGLDRLDQRALPLSTTYSAPTDATNVRAFIIDTGINKTHVDFGSRVVSGFDAVTAGADGSNDCNGHGTHVAGSVGGTTYGVAKGVTLVPVRVLDCAGSGTNSGVIAGLDWVASQHVAGQLDVANMSLGGGASSALDTAVNNTITKGVTVVVAAGNSNANACNYSPARVPAAITVAASDRTDVRATFSNFGSCVDVFAPGVLITSAWFGSTTATATISGTSMASPHVAGLAALTLQLKGDLTPALVASEITTNATTGIITSVGTGSPNRLAFVSSDPLAPTTTTIPVVRTVPATPLAPIATSRSKSVTATWTIPADGGSTITSQTVRLFSGTTVIKTSTVTPTAKSLTFTGLRNGVSYAVSVSATNDIGAGAQSPKSNVVIPR